MEPKKDKPWKKNLYENNGYEDNYTDENFLKDLKKNYNIREFTFLECFYGVTKVSQEISCVSLFLVIFHDLYVNTIQPQKLLFNSFVFTGFGYIAYIITDTEKIHNVIEDSKTVGVVLLFGYMFSPLLHTLTDSISTDTIFFNTFIILSFHLLLHDYGIDGFLVSKTVSLNCGIFASICLASRLSTTHHAFVLLVISAEVFVLKPLLFEKIWRPWMLIPMTAVTIFFLQNISQLLGSIYIIILTFINVIFPYIFQKLTHKKCTISGPWDEALIEDLNNETNKKFT
ncbi:CLUMA_CG012591, isoform A [Clunio marinus]|uniref:CLUMA_CG012591, isoform A n=1 Tax=Clunio marinus TaxID=568069 RepID=A0A1J1IGU2_9DIPT|nr:CLUMA_CG012591, isoform A [Clunio marinus]